MGKICVCQTGNEGEGICNRFFIALWVRLTVWLAFFSRVATISRTEVAVTSEEKEHHFKCGETATLT